MQPTDASPDRVERLQRDYDTWHEEHASHGLDANTQAFYAWIVDLLGNAPEDELLDVACGSGAFLRYAGDHGARRLHGFDVSPVAIERAQELVPNADLRVGDAEQLPFDDASFDRVTCIGSLEHFPDPARGAAEIARVLRPGGTAVVFVPNLFFLGHVWLGLRHGTQPSEGDQDFSETFRSSQGWRSLLEEGGLGVTRMETWNHIHASRKVSPLTMRAWNAVSRLVPRNGAYAFAFVCSPRRPLA